MLLEEESPAHEDGSGTTSSFGSTVIIVQVRRHSPDSGSFHPSQSAAKVNKRPKRQRPSFMALMMFYDVALAQRIHDRTLTYDFFRLV
jgi:hypothetical protein